MLELWWATARDQPTAASLASLTPEELARFHRLRRPQDRAEYATAHAMLRRLLVLRLGADRVQMSRRPCPCCGGAHGRPFVSSPPTELEVSLSHGGGLVAIALCGAGPVGVDTESLSADASGIETTLHHLEQHELAGAPEDLRRTLLMRIWVRKEAYLKAIGTGLGRDPSLDYVAPGQPDLHPTGWMFHEVELAAGSVTALCAPTSAGALVVRCASAQDWG